MGFLQRIFGGNSAGPASPEHVYRQIMQQSRRPVFYGEGKFPDSYDGRIESLTMHMAIYFRGLRAHSAHGKNFSQGIFDSMVKDFDTAFREEGFTDTGVKHRIHKIIKFFYKRLKDVTESLDDRDKLLEAVGSQALKEGDADFVADIADYLIESKNMVDQASLEDLRTSKVVFPEFGN